ncbi:MAG TPA: oligosaccharide flippase family protein [Thermoanaerobaculia bacterium]|nr:oligosaccharide flippase family protein [Thermoanaerobaculia bacterium]
MLKAFIRDGAIYGVLRVLTGGIAVLLLPLYTRALAPSEYGLLELVTILGTVCTTIMTLEVAQGLARHYALGSSARERKLFASTAFWFTTASFSLAVVIVWFFAPAIARVLSGSAAHAGALRIAVAAIAGQAMLYAVLTGIRYAGRALHYAVGSLTFSAAAIGAALFFLVKLRWGLPGVFAAQLFASAVAVAVSCLLAREEIGFVFDGRKLRQMLQFSAPLVLSTLGVLAATYADRIAVRSFLTIDTLGVYSVGARVASAVTIAMAAFQMALSPLIYKHHAEPEAPMNIERLFRWFVAATSVPLLFVGVFATDIVRIAATRAYDGAAAVIFLLGLSALVGNLYLFAPGLWIARRTGTIAAINLAVATSSLLLSMLVVRRLGFPGVALVSCVVAFVSFSVQLALSQRSYRVPLQWGRLLPAAGVLVFFAVAGWLWNLAAADVVVKSLVFVTSSALVFFTLIRRDEIRAGLGHFGATNAVPR